MANFTIKDVNASFSDKRFNFSLLFPSLFLSTTFPNPKLIRFNPIVTKHLIKFFREDFNTGSRTVEVEMMNNKGKIPYQYNSNLEFESIQLDFHGRYYSAVFVLPHKRQTISNLIGLLDKSALREILSQTNYRGVNYKIPKMKFFSSRSLKEPLASRGLSKLFDKANLALMLDTSAHKISDVKHAVEIEVDELGAKATALTSVRIEPLAAKNPPENTVDFILDRPFIFMIQHRISGTILFTAIVREPSQ